MDEMKHDMSGAAAVIGALRAAALLELPTPVVGVIAAAENMPSATAYRPGDVVTTMAGKTIEVLNTDAEGRVVLADALHYARTEFEPDAIVDLATLTGAMVVALGAFATGLFGNHAKLVELVRAAGEAAGERVWPMPLADAAAFLWHFVGDTPWVHLDIAGTAWTSKPGPVQRKGATGVGVRLLVELLRHWDPAALRA
jgi:leucyl aminopeptidase